MVESNEKELKEKMDPIGGKPLKKLEGIKNEHVKVKDYFKSKNLEDVRVMFRIRTRMVELKANFKNNPAFRKEGWICDGCELEIETNSHVMNCRAYDQVRVGKNLESEKDLILYFREVMKLRMTKKKM